MDAETTTINRQDRSGTRRGHRPWWIAGAVLVLALLAWVFHGRGAGTADGAAAAPPPAQVTVALPLRRALPPQLDFVGQLAAVDQVELRPQVGGTLVGIHFRDGAIVRRGQLLFTIDPTPYRIRLAQAQAALAAATARSGLAGSELRRARELQQGDAGTVQNVEQRDAEQRGARAAIDDARAQVRDAQFDLDHARITAPFTGRIGTHLVSVGTLVGGSRSGTAATTLLATLVSLDPIHLDFDMSQADYALFQQARGARAGALGNRVLIAPSDDHFTRTGTLDFIDNALDRSSGTIRARATVANPASDLTPGAFAKVRLDVDGTVPTLLVPDAAVLPDQSRHIVLVVDAANKVTPKPVDIGDMRGGLRVIRSGLAPGDRVVISGVPLAQPGATVKPSLGAIRFDPAADR